MAALRAYVSRLRGLLGPAADLRYRPPGYSLTLAAATLDAAEFEELVGAARAAGAAGEHARAVTDLTAALALWRGDALAEFADDEFAAAEAVRLTELRTTALEERAEALLELGRAAEALPELEALVSRHPARERPAVALMRALYATGPAGRCARRLPRPARPARRRAGGGALPRPRRSSTSGSWPTTRPWPGPRRRATCRGGPAVSSAGTGRSSACSPRCGPGRWSR